MNKLAKEITKADLISLEEYSKKRKVLRKEIVSYKKNRRIALGPYANFYFESTKWVDKFTSAFNIRIAVTLVVHHKADNKPIGYTVFNSQPALKNVLNDFTIIDPSYRSKGLFLELNILKHRFIYNSSTPIETSQTKILKGKEHCLTGLYTNIIGELEINPHGIYEVATCTKEQWTSWFNASSYTNNYYEVI